MHKYGLINLVGEFVLEPKFDAVFRADDGGPTCVLTDVESRRITPDGRIEGGTMYYVGRDGERAFDGEYEEAGCFSDGLAVVRIRDQWGYVDWSGDLAVEPKFQAAFAFSGGIARVKIDDDRYGYIDRRGEWVHPPTLRRAEKFSCGLAAASLSGGGLHGYLDVRGRWAIPEEYRWPRNFADGLAFATTDDFAGFIDTAGRRVIAFDEPWKGHGFSEGLADVLFEGRLGEEPRKGYIDLRGELVIPFSFDSAGSFGCGHATVRVDGKWGVIDRTGHYTVPPSYDDALYGFNEGLAPVKKDGGYRYIDPTGTLAFGEKTFMAADPFANGVARVGIEAS